MSKPNSNRPRLTGRTLLAALALACLLGAVSVVGVSSASTKAALSGQPIKISVTSFTGSPIGNYPQAWAGAEAAARDINAHGGIDKHRLQIIACNTRGTPDGETACARQAISSGAIAEVGEIVFANPGGFDATLLNGGVPSVAPVGIAPQQYANPNSFPITYIGSQFLACVNPKLYRIIGADRVAAVSVANALNSYQLQQLEARAKALGLTLAGSVEAGATQTDFAPIVTQIANLNPNFVILGMRPDQNPSFMVAALSQGKTWAYCNSDMNFGPGQIANLGQAAANYYQGASLPPITATSQFPQLRKFIADMNAEQKAGDAAASLSPTNYYSAAMNSWLGVELLARVIPTMKGALTSRNLWTTLKTAKVKLGLVPPIDFSKPKQVGIDKRVFNSTIMVEKWNANKQEFFVVPGATVKL
jgi:ABC-type branched-subunit amino acid transport system substrate-binding protein